MVRALGSMNEVIENKEDAKKLWAFFEALRKEKDEKRREAN
jgi:DNA phosphorothioation-dependent restriction protein DptG